MKRLLNASEAAEYCGMSTSSFAANCPVRPKRVRPGQRGLRWDVRDLDKWIDGLSPDGEDLLTSPEEWLELMDAPRENTRRQGLCKQRPMLRLPQGDRDAA